MKTRFYKIIRFLLKLIVVITVLILSGYVYIYFKQERFFFNPKTLDKNYVFEFKESFEEYDISVDEGIELNALLFKTDSVAKGVILYFHGNAGAIHEWGERAPLYTENGYDILFVDYRGYGKSDSQYSNESQIYNDAQKIYDFVKTKYNEEDIIVLGFSLGSGFASYVASKNNPKSLILEAPFFAWNESISNIAPFIPQWMINYEIPSNKFLGDVKCPIKIYHGSKDFLIVPEVSSIKLKKLYPEKIDLTFIKGAGHNGIYITKQYYDELKILLEK